MIAKKQKYIAGAAVIVVVLAAALIAVTFSGKGKEKEDIQEADASSSGQELTQQPEDMAYMEELIQAREAELAVLEAQLRAEIEQQKLQQDAETVYDDPCPDASRISDSFGARVHPLTGETKVHEGVDFAAEKGTDILAAAEGTVYETGFDADYGNYIVLYHSASGEYTHYRHCDEIFAAEEESVSRGQKIATVGSTGRSTGPHLHFAIEKDGEYIEPPFSVAGM